MPVLCNTDWTPIKMPDGQRRQNLVLIRSGDLDLFTKWPKDLNGVDRNWDLMLSHWGKEEPPADHADFVVRQGAYKFLAVARLWRDIPWLSSYKSVWLCDEDVMTSWSDVQRMFDLFSSYELDLAQPALSEDSEGSHRITFFHKGNLVRFVDFVEAMMPLFSRRALEICMPSFEEGNYAHGLDYVWPQLLGRPTNKMAILDAIQVRHGRKVGQSAIYGEMKQQNFDANEQLLRLQAKYGFGALSQLEFGCILDRPRQGRGGYVQAVERTDLQLEGRLVPLINAFAKAPLTAAWQGRDPIWRLSTPWLGGDTQVHKIPQLMADDWCLSIAFTLAVMQKPGTDKSLVLGLGSQSDLRVVLSHMNQTDQSYQLVIEILGKQKKTVRVTLPNLPLGRDTHIGLQLFPAAGWLRLWVNRSALPDIWYEPLAWNDADMLFIGSPELDAGLGDLWLSPAAIQEQAA